MLQGSKDSYITKVIVLLHPQRAYARLIIPHLFVHSPWPGKLVVTHQDYTKASCVEHSIKVRLSPSNNIVAIFYRNALCLLLVSFYQWGRERVVLTM